MRRFLFEKFVSLNLLLKTGCLLFCFLFVFVFWLRVYLEARCILILSRHCHLSHYFALIIRPQRSRENTVDPTRLLLAHQHALVLSQRLAVCFDQRDLKLS